MAATAMAAAANEMSLEMVKAIPQKLFDVFNGGNEVVKKVTESNASVAKQAVASVNEEKRSLLKKLENTDLTTEQEAKIHDQLTRCDKEIQEILARNTSFNSDALGKAAGFGCLALSAVNLIVTSGLPKKAAVAVPKIATNAMKLLK